MHIDLDERPLSQLVPGLYQASWDFRRSNERSASKSSRASRATVRIRRPSMTRMHSEQAMDRASLDSVLDSNPPSQRGIISQASDSFIGERIHRAGTGADQDLALAELQRKVDKLAMTQEQLLVQVRETVKSAVADAVADAISGVGRRVAHAMVVSEEGGSVQPTEQGSGAGAASRARDQGRLRLHDMLPSLPSVSQLPGVRPAQTDRTR